MQIAKCIIVFTILIILGVKFIAKKIPLCASYQLISSFYSFFSASFLCSVCFCFWNYLVYGIFTFSFTLSHAVQSSFTLFGVSYCIQSCTSCLRLKHIPCLQKQLQPAKDVLSKNYQHHTFRICSI